MTSITVRNVPQEARDRGSWAEDLLAENRLAGPHLLFVETANILRRLELVLTPLP